MLFVIFCCLSGLLPAQQTRVVTWLSETDHDFGQMRANHPESYIFRFKNTSADTVVLQTARTTCGCTAAKWTEAPIPPGREGELTVEYDAFHHGGFAKKIRVFFDRQRKPEILWVRGEVD